MKVNPNTSDDVKESPEIPESAERFSLQWLGFAVTLSFFLIFFSFGCRSFGGPVARINMMRDEQIIKKKWISLDRFYRVYSVYQIIPGPEATEIAIYFGNLAKGNIGGIIAGLANLLPGVSLMLLWSW
eukprot:gene18207-37019_t